MNQLVSILIPAFNAEDWIAQTIESAIGQSWPNKEIIVVDDGSTDDTARIVRGFARDKVRLVTQQNQGAAAARNAAFVVSQGEYIQWLDADDLLSRDKITRQMEEAQRLNDKYTLLSCGWGSFRYRTSKAVFSPSLLWTDLSPPEWLLRKWEANDHMQTATWLVSRELTQAAGPWDTRLLGDDDGEYFSRVIHASKGIRFVSDAKVFYRITPSGRLSYIGLSDEKIGAQFFSMKLQIGYLLAKEDTFRARAACVNYLQTWLHNFYPNRPDIVNEAREMANRLGGQLCLPRASWKYAWIETLFGFSAAKRAQLYYNRNKSSFLRAWDKMMSSFERRGLPG